MLQRVSDDPIKGLRDNVNILEEMLKERNGDQDIESLKGTIADLQESQRNRVALLVRLEDLVGEENKALRLGGVKKGANQEQSTTKDSQKSLRLPKDNRTQNETSISPTDDDSGTMLPKRPERPKGNSLQRRVSHDHTCLDGSHSGSPNSASQEGKFFLDEQDSESGDETHTPSSYAIPEIPGFPRHRSQTDEDYRRESAPIRREIEFQKRKENGGTEGSPRRGFKTFIR